MNKPWQTYAVHIIDAIAKIRRIQLRGDFTQDDILYDAVLRNLQTLSESTQRIPDSLKALHPELPWREMSGFRNILVHNYLGDIDPKTVRQVVVTHLDDLERCVTQMLSLRRE